VGETDGTAERAVQPPADRYGPGPRPARRLVGYALLGLLAAAGLAWLLWAAYSYARPPVRATLQSYQVTSDRAVTVRFELVKDPEYAASCTVRARNRDGEEVGRREVTVPVGVRKTVLTETLTTTERPITGEVKDCRLLDS
jgi:hypothetical protein